MKVTGRELDNLPCCTSLAQRLPNRAIPSEAIAGVERGSVHIDEHFGTCDTKIRLADDWSLNLWTHGHLLFDLDAMRLEEAKELEFER